MSTRIVQDVPTLVFELLARGLASVARIFWRLRVSCRGDRARWAASGGLLDTAAGGLGRELLA